MKLLDLGIVELLYLSRIILIPIKTSYDNQVLRIYRNRVFNDNVIASIECNNKTMNVIEMKNRVLPEDRDSGMEYNPFASQSSFDVFSKDFDGIIAVIWNACSSGGTIIRVDGDRYRILIVSINGDVERRVTMTKISSQCHPEILCYIVNKHYNNSILFLFETNHIVFSASYVDEDNIVITDGDSWVFYNLITEEIEDIDQYNEEYTKIPLEISKELFQSLLRVTLQ